MRFCGDRSLPPPVSTGSGSAGRRLLPSSQARISAPPGWGEHRGVGVACNGEIGGASDSRGVCSWGLPFDFARGERGGPLRSSLARGVAGSYQTEGEVRETSVARPSPSVTFGATSPWRGRIEHLKERPLPGLGQRPFLLFRAPSVVAKLRLVACCAALAGLGRVLHQIGAGRPAPQNLKFTVPRSECQRRYSSLRRKVVPLVLGAIRNGLLASRTGLPASAVPAVTRTRASLS